MSFHEVQFPVSLSFGASGGPETRSEIVTLQNGFEERNTPWSQSRRRYEAGLGLRDMDDVAAVLAFFEARRGPIHGFRWKDWSDYKSGLPSATPSEADQLIAIGDGETAAFQLVKTYRSGAFEQRREITKPVSGTLRVAVAGDTMVEGIHFEVDPTTGILTFSEIPELGEEITAGYEFDVPARFDTDMLSISNAGFNAGEVPNIPVVEIRL
jgi:uncharacterized protein (TIGR02217 family)